MRRMREAYKADDHAVSPVTGGSSKGREREIDPEVEIRRLRDRVGDLEQVVAASGTARRVDEDREDMGPAQKHARWNCRACGSLLGFYDHEADVMRIRYKDHVTFVRCGPGGFVQTLCRSCAQINTQEYASPDEVARTNETARAPVTGRSR